MNSEKSSREKKSKNKPFYNFLYDFVKVTGVLPTYLVFRPKVYHPYGKNKIRGAVMITANHRSDLDPVWVHVAIPSRRLHCLATKNLYDTELKAFFFDKMHCIKVDKENFAVSAFHDVVSRLNEGHAVVIFPEGRINTSDDNTILAFKSGAVLMASKANAPIIPVYIVKREKWYQRQRIVVGEVFHIESENGKMLPLDRLNEISEKLHEKEVELREYFESLPIFKKLNKNKKTEKDPSAERNVNDNAEQKV